MKKIIIYLLLLPSYIFSNINAIVSIGPQETFLKAIAGDKVNITLMVKQGNSPHNYAPKPSQMIAVANANIYFSIGVEFEHIWLSKFKNLNPKMQISSLSKNIKLKAMKSTTHLHLHEKSSSLDPHIWTSPTHVKTIAYNIYETLSNYDKKNEAYYKTNLEIFLSKVKQTDTQIKSILAVEIKTRKFMVLHPSWGYFAQNYNLEQIAVEIEGKSPKPRELIALIKKAREEKVNAIFTQAEFSESAANIIAKELDIPVVKVTPLALNWSENLIYIAKTIAGKK